MSTPFPVPPTFEILPTVPPNWMCIEMTNALQKRHLDFPVVAFQAAQGLDDSEILAYRRIPNAQGQVFNDNRNLIETARMALLVTTFEGDAGLTSSLTPFGSAVDLTIRTVKTFIGMEHATIEKLLNYIAYDTIGLMNVFARDRAAWGYAIRAIGSLPESSVFFGDPTRVFASQGFRVVFEQAKQWLAQGPWTPDCNEQLGELANQVLVGTGLTEVPEYREVANLVSNERVVGNAMREMLRMLGVEESLDPEMEGIFQSVEARRRTPVFEYSH